MHLTDLRWSDSSVSIVRFHFITVLPGCKFTQNKLGCWLALFLVDELLHASHVRAPQPGDACGNLGQDILQRLRLAGILGRTPAHLSLRNRPLAKDGSSLARRPGRPRGSPAAAAGLPSECRRQELLWRQFFQDPTLWVDNRQRKKSSGSPDFRHRESHQVLWINKLYKPAWVDAQLAALDMEMGPSALSSHSSERDDGDFCRPAVYERGLTAETVSKLCQQGQLSEAVEAMGVLVKTDCHVARSLFLMLLKECVGKKDLPLGRRVHALTVKKGSESDTFLCNHVLRMYVSHARLEEAMDVFSKVAKLDAFTWSAIISAHVKHGQEKQAMQLYHRMRSSSVKPDGHVFVAALQACARGADLKSGQQVHADLLASSVEPNLFVWNGLVDMYAKCGSLEDAQRVFDGLDEKDVVTWSAMIAGYSQKGMGQKALDLYNSMQDEGIVIPNSVTFVCLLQACASVGTLALERGKQLHAQIGERGLQADVVVGGSLVNMYAKCGSIEDARGVFDKLGQKNVVTWSGMIAGYSQQGMGQEAIHLYTVMQEEGIVAPDAVTFVSLLQACASVGTAALEMGKKLHVKVKEQGLQTDVFVSSSLVNMYAKCGSLEDAQRVFDVLGEKNVVTWSAMITGYSQQGKGQQALWLHNAMLEQGICGLDAVTFVCLLQACASVGHPALEKGKQIHAQIKEQGLQVDSFVASSLISMYAKCGSLENAQSVFNTLGLKNVVTWNAMIAGYSQQGMGREALRVYTAMEEEGMVAPNSVTFISLLQACACLGTPALEKGKELHAQIRARSLQVDVLVASSLVSMYTKCASLQEAREVFDGIGQKDVVTWSAMIAGYSQQGRAQEALCLYCAMEEDQMVVPDSVTFVCLLQACASVGTLALEKGRQLHAEIRERGLQADEYVASSLVNMYAKCGSLEDARAVFDELEKKSVVMWSAMIAGYSQQGMGQEALCLYGAMEEQKVAAPNSVTFVCLLQACASVGTPAFEKGRHLHAQIREQGLQADVFVATSLVNMYAKCGSLEDARSVFDGLGLKNQVTWSAIIAGYSQHGMGQEALCLYRAMQEEGIAALDSVTFVSLLQACASVGTPALETGKELYARIREQSLQSDVFIANSLVDMYSKCGSLEDAQGVFDRHHQKDAGMWNAIIAGYFHKGLGQQALRLYRGMQEEGHIAPNSVTFVCLLQACASVASLHLGRQLHVHLKEQGLQADVLVAGSLINMYGKCGSMPDAQQVFEELPKRDIVTWSALIAGYTRQGDSEKVFDLVSKMREDGIQPDAITFLSILTVCSHTGLVDKGRQYFEDMSKQYGIIPTADHYTCMVDLLGRAGELDEALDLVRKMPVQPDAAMWHTLLGACRKWSNVEVGRHAFEEALKLDKTDAAAYVLMSSIYTGAQMWEQAQEMQLKRIRTKSWKQPGESCWTDVDGLVHSFLVGHPGVMEGRE